MLSLLVRQYLFLTEAFQTRYPSSWLIWEPGAWRPARTTLEGDSTATRQAEARGPARPVGTDALCFELKNGPGTAHHSVGRSSESGIFINDLTLSRDQLVLSFESGKWNVSVEATATAPTLLNGRPFPPGSVVPLLDGTTLAAGEVHFTFYDLKGFLARLKLEADHLKT
jgi:FHA domain